MIVRKKTLLKAHKIISFFILEAFVKENIYQNNIDSGYYLEDMRDLMHKEKGVMIPKLNIGDYIVIHPDKMIYVSKPQVFETNYEVVEDIL